MPPVRQIMGIWRLWLFFGDSGVTTNVDSTGLLLQKRSSAPWAFYYLDGVPQIQRTGWQMVDGAWRYFEGDGSLAMGWTAN